MNPNDKGSYVTLSNGNMTSTNYWLLVGRESNHYQKLRQVVLGSYLR